MSHQFDAIYDDGVFKPLVPLALPDKARVKITVDALPMSEATVASQKSTDFDAELEALLFDGPNLPADFSRADIYADHD